ncbi:unnamed protein product, partial [Vitis vinifera]|uniref:Uncharacterized protein n=1 Tax=Vitis vinifera TaxID=29760 RepID=D7TSM5_VITVI
MSYRVLKKKNAHQIIQEKGNFYYYYY